MATITETTPELVSFIAGVQELVDLRYAPYAPEQGVKVTLEIGPKNIRVVKNLILHGKDANQRSVYCFINRETGDILKDAGWKGPVKNGKRGNIFTEDNGLKSVDGFGCRYRR